MSKKRNLVADGYATWKEKDPKESWGSFEQFHYPTSKYNQPEKLNFMRDFIPKSQKSRKNWPAISIFKVPVSNFRKIISECLSEVLQYIFELLLLTSK